MCELTRSLSVITKCTVLACFASVMPCSSISAREAAMPNLAGKNAKCIRHALGPLFGNHSNASRVTRAYNAVRRIATADQDSVRQSSTTVSVTFKQCNVLVQYPMATSHLRRGPLTLFFHQHSLLSQPLVVERAVGTNLLATGACRWHVVFAQNLTGER